MKGIIINLLEDMVEREDGPEGWDALLDEVGVDGGYTSLGSYPDAELVALLTARAEQQELSLPDMLRVFGHHALLGLAERYPAYFTPHRHTRDFLLTLNDVIHPEVRKVHAEARPPEFDFEASGEDRLAIVYRSERHLCHVAEGMIAGAATHYGERVEVVQEPCVHTGGDQCVLHCTFREPGDAPALG